METFYALLAVCAGNSPVPGEFPAQRPVTRSFHVFFDLGPNKRLSKQSWDWWFETLPRSLWRHRNVSMLQVKFCRLLGTETYCWLIVNVTLGSSHSRYYAFIPSAERPRLRFHLCWFVSLSVFVCLLATIRENAWMDFHEIFICCARYNKGTIWKIWLLVCSTPCKHSFFF